MKDKLLKALWIILPPIIGVVGGIYIYNYQQSDKYATRKLDVLIDTHHQDYKELEYNKLQITYKGEPVHGYNNIHIRLYNFEDMWFQNVPVYINVIPEDGDSIQFVSVALTDPKGAVKDISGFPISDRKYLKFGYSINVANYTHEFNGPPILDINIMAISSKVPKVTAKINYVGIDENPEPYPAGLDKYTSFWDSFWGFLIFILLAILALAIVVLPISKIINVIRAPIMEKKSRLLFEKRLATIKERIKEGKIPPDDPEKIIEQYLELEYALKYYETVWFEKWASHMEKPTEKDVIK